MRFNRLSPSAQLRQYVDYYMVLESQEGDNAFPTEVFPSIQTEMTFTYGSPNSSFVQNGKDKKRRALDYSLAGFITKRAIYTNEGHLGVIMVGFKPWGLSSFFEFNISALIDNSLDLNDICPKEMRRIEDVIRTKTTDEARIQVIEEFLLSLVKPDARDPLIERAVHEILEKQGVVSVSELANDFHLSQKQFTRRFVRTVGATPKLYSKLARFQHVLTMINDSNAKLTELAYKAGYFDQSHFIKEIRDFTTETPSSLKHKSLQSELGQYFREQSKKSIFYNPAYM